MKTTKTLLLILSIYFCNQNSFSQKWDKVFDKNPYSSFNDIKFTSDKGFVAGISYGESCLSQEIFKYDSLGNLVWENISNVLGVNAIHITTNNNIIYAGLYQPQDDVGVSMHLTLSKMDSNGNYIFNDSILYVTNITCEYTPSGLTESDNGNIYIYTCSRVIKTDSVGNIIWNKNYSNIQPIKYLQLISNNQFVLSNSNKIYKIDDAGIFLDSILLPQQNAMLVYNDTICIAKQNKIITLNTNLTVLDTIDFSSVFSTIHQIERENTNIWLKGISLDETQIMINKISNTFQSINIYSVPTIKIDTTAIFRVASNKFILASNRLGQSSVSYFDHDNFSVDNSYSDISPEGLSIDNIQLDYQNIGGQIHQVGFRFDAHVSIKNSGDNIINGLALYSLQTGFMNCYINYDYQKYTNLNILPNQPVSLDFPDIYEMLPLNNAMYHYCLKCLAPNSIIETNITNNSICGDFLIVGVDNIKLEKSTINIYPNPFIDELYIQLEKDLFDKSTDRTFELTKLTGETIISKPINFEIEKINLMGFASGIYIAKIKTDKMRITQKIIKF